MVPKAELRPDELVPGMIESGRMCLFGCWWPEMTPLDDPGYRGVTFAPAHPGARLWCARVDSKQREAPRGPLGMWLERGEQKN